MIGSADAFTRTAPSDLPVKLRKLVVVCLITVVVAFLTVPVIVTVVASFAHEWTGFLPTGFVTLEHWWQAIGLPKQTIRIRELGLTLGEIGVKGTVGNQRGLGNGLVVSVLLAVGGVVVNLLVGIPIAYVISRYDFTGRDWLSTFAVLPLVPGLILGIAFLRAYPTISQSGIALILGYSLLKLPFMVVAVKSSFESMDLRQLEESARALGASWPRAFLTVIVPNAKRGILAGSIICWTLAAAEFNFSYVVYSKGARPLSLFLFSNISNSSFLQAAAAVSIYFGIVSVVTLVLRLTGTRGFASAGGY